MIAPDDCRRGSTDSGLTMVNPPARRQPFFVLDSQSVDNQYVFTSLRFWSKEKHCKLNPACCKESKHVYLFKYHFDRLKDSAGCRGWYEAQKSLKRPIDLYNRVSNAVACYEKNNHSKGPYKVRIKLKYHGNIQIDVDQDVSPEKKPLLYPSTLDLHKHPHDAAKRCDAFTALLDALPTNKSLHTKSKTEWRSTYDYARVSAGLESYQDAKEVLLFNADGELMDGSITTPYFFRNGKWTTPHTSCGGQVGTTRRWAIDQNLCVMGTIPTESLRHDEVIWLSNSVKGFFTARFIADPQRCQAPSFRANSTSTSSSITAVDSPISDKAKSIVWNYTSEDINSAEEDDKDSFKSFVSEEAQVSPHSSALYRSESPTSPAVPELDLDAPRSQYLSPGKPNSFLKVPNRNSGKIVFRMPTFLGCDKHTRIEANRSVSPSDLSTSPMAERRPSVFMPHAAYEIL